VVESDRLQLGEPVAAAGAAEKNRELVADEFAATVGEARHLQLAIAGGESFDAKAVWKHGAADRSAAGAGGIGEPQIAADSGPRPFTGSEKEAGTVRREVSRCRMLGVREPKMGIPAEIVFYLNRGASLPDTVARQLVSKGGRFVAIGECLAREVT